MILKKWLKKAELYKEDDEKLKRKIELKNNLENYLYQTKSTINDYKIKQKIDENDLNTLTELINKQLKWVENTNNENY